MSLIEEIDSKENREEEKEFARLWLIPSNLSVKQIKETIDDFAAAVTFNLHPDNHEDRLASHTAILIDDILEMDSISEEEKDEEIFRLVQNYPEDQQKLKELAERVLVKIDEDVENYKTESVKRGYCPELVRYRVEGDTSDGQEISALVKQAQELGFLNKITAEEVEFVEQELNLKLDKQFKQLVAECSYESFSKFNFYGFADKGKAGVVASTLTLRKHWGLPSDYISLAADGSKIALMSIINENMSQVLWCELEDMQSICAEKEMQHEPRVFTSFLDFYKFLVEEEEKLRKK